MQRNNALWSEQLPLLVDALLHFHAYGSQQDPPLSPPTPTDPDVTYFTVDMFSWHGRNRNFIVVQSKDDVHASEALIRNGLISNSPVIPDYAFSIHTLESFRRLRLRSPRISIQAFVKAMCDTQHSVSFHALYDPFTLAFDIYLRLLKAVDALVNVQLGRQDPDWRVRHACPCCHYQLVNEAPLPHDLLLCLDGGSSMKRFAQAGMAADSLVYSSNYIIPRTEVDVFAKPDKTPRAPPPTTPSTVNLGKKGGRKPKARAKGKKAKQPAAPVEEDVMDIDDDEDDAAIETAAQAVDDVTAEGGIVIKGPMVGMSIEEDELISKCAERWKANADDSKKGMFDCFEETGIGVSLCRHGILYFIVDMVCSGEL